MLNTSCNLTHLTHLTRLTQSSSAPEHCEHCAKNWPRRGVRTQCEVSAKCLQAMETRNWIQQGTLSHASHIKPHQAKLCGSYGFSHPLLRWHAAGRSCVPRVAWAWAGPALNWATEIEEMWRNVKCQNEQTKQQLRGAAAEVWAGEKQSKVANLICLFHGISCPTKLPSEFVLSVFSSQGKTKSLAGRTAVVWERPRELNWTRWSEAMS